MALNLLWDMNYDHAYKFYLVFEDYYGYELLLCSQLLFAAFLNCFTFLVASRVSFLYNFVSTSQLKIPPIFFFCQKDKGLANQCPQGNG